MTVGLWAQVIVVLLAGAGGAAVALTVSVRRGARGRRTSDPSVPPAQQERTWPAPLVADRATDPWLCELYRCEQAVSRAYRVVNAVSSVSARGGLHCVVHRMEAELPNVRVLVELGRGLDSDRAHPARGGRGADPVRWRARRQLGVAAVRFRAVADRLSESVSELVAEPDLERVHRQVGQLRERFPLVPPMSAVLRPGSRAGGETGRGVVPGEVFVDGAVDGVPADESPADVSSRGVLPPVERSSRDARSGDQQPVSR